MKMEKILYATVILYMAVLMVSMSIAYVENSAITSAVCAIIMICGFGVVVAEMCILTSLEDRV